MIEKKTTKEIISEDASRRRLHYDLQLGESRDNFNDFHLILSLFFITLSI